MKEAKLEVGLIDKNILPEELDKHIHVQGKLKNKLKNKIHEGLTKLQEVRMTELVNNMDAQKLFEDDPVFQFMLRCSQESVPFLPILNSMAGKRLVLVNQKNITA
jgi:hypothetical protein